MAESKRDEKKAPRYKCAGPSCPGLPYKASEMAHPPSCAELAAVDADAGEAARAALALSDRAKEIRDQRGRLVAIVYRLEDAQRILRAHDALRFYAESKRREVSTSLARIDAGIDMLVEERDRLRKALRSLLRSAEEALADRESNKTVWADDVAAQCRAALGRGKSQ